MTRPCSQDLREQADRVQQSLTDRVAETEEATRKLETNLKKTVDEIAQVGLRMLTLTALANTMQSCCTLVQSTAFFAVNTAEYIQLRFYLRLMEIIM